MSIEYVMGDSEKHSNVVLKYIYIYINIFRQETSDHQSFNLSQTTFKLISCTSIFHLSTYKLIFCCYRVMSCTDSNLLLFNIITCNHGNKILRNFNMIAMSHNAIPYSHYNKALNDILLESHFLSQIIQVSPTF